MLDAHRDARLQDIQTPFYLYDTDLLQQTLDVIRAEAGSHPCYHVHYAIKANSNPVILRQIAAAGLGADCVSGGEIHAAVESGFKPDSIVFAGVGKADWEIRLALQTGIGAFNVESTEELDVIAQLAAEQQLTARISLRINPDVAAHTHAHITTGRAENKFGIDRNHMVEVIRKTLATPHLDFVGLHFHIGSQMLDMSDFLALALRINEIQDQLEAEGIRLPSINVGGGLGVDYDHPDRHPIPDFAAYFATYSDNLRLRPGQHLHFELGRSVVAQMGSLISRVLYVKHGTVKRFAILDAGMTELIRPALYGALHAIQTFDIDGGRPCFASARRDSDYVTYDVVGPICESSDVFARDYPLPPLQRGDMVAIRSAGAYGEVMASCYNCRQLPAVHTVNDLQERLKR